MKAGRGKRLGLLALCLFGTILFTGLGIWQIQRLSWKRNLIEHVEARIHAPPVAVPASRDWGALDLNEAEYRRVRVSGVFLHDRETLVDALTARGPGAWVLTPLQTADGVMLVNRGFVPPERRAAKDREAGQTAGDVTITGLLRITEPEGRILRPNDPPADRWFSRDVGAIARVRGLQTVAPFFIDAEAAAGPEGAPIGGMTVVQFRNAHAVYAATWFGLAALCITGLVLL
ncbi:MAG: SURF1 family protein [Steroidobacteraceae bacterium]